MSLFVGNVSRFVEQKDIEREFRQFGECAVDFRNSKKGKFAFIQFKNDADAEQAKRNLQGKDLQGLKLNIEWSKKSGRFDENRGAPMKEVKKEQRRSRSRSHKRSRKERRSRSRTKSRSHGRNRSAPKYANHSRSISQEQEVTCPRDRILKEKLKEMKRAKKEKKEEQQQQQQSQQIPAVVAPPPPVIEEAEKIIQE